MPTDDRSDRWPDAPTTEIPAATAGGRAARAGTRGTGEPRFPRIARTPHGNGAGVGAGEMDMEDRAQPGVLRAATATVVAPEAAEAPVSSGADAGAGAWPGDGLSAPDAGPQAPPDPARLRDVEPDPAPAGPGFATVWRGYEPAAVDAYVRQVTRALEELEAQRTPEGVVRRALDQVGEETSTILREAQETSDRIRTRARTESDELLTSARTESDELLARARAESDELLRSAQQRLTQLDSDIDRIWLERQRLIDDTRRLADRLIGVATQAEERFPAEEGAPAPDEAPASAAASAED